MATITEDYCDFETAKLLKEKGFNEKTEYTYSNNGELLRLNNLGIKDLTNTDCNGYHTWQFPIEGVASIISAPTQQMAMKWLREVHNIHIVIKIVIRTYGDTEYYYELYGTKNKSLCVVCDIYKGETWSRSEKATEEAIKYCLKHLI